MVKRKDPPRAAVSPPSSSTLTLLLTERPMAPGEDFSPAPWGTLEAQVRPRARIPTCHGLSTCRGRALERRPHLSPPPSFGNLEEQRSPESADGGLLDFIH